MLSCTTQGPRTSNARSSSPFSSSFCRHMSAIILQNSSLSNTQLPAKLTVVAQEMDNAHQTRSQMAVKPPKEVPWPAGAQGLDPPCRTCTSTESHLFACSCVLWHVFLFHWQRLQPVFFNYQPPRIRKYMYGCLLNSNPLDLEISTKQKRILRCGCQVTCR